jgi:acetyl esterase/lipase
MNLTARLCTALVFLLSVDFAAAQNKPADAAPKKNPPAKKKPAPAPTVYAKSVPKPTATELKYGEHPRNVIDFWQAISDKPTPVILFIHGGGWMNGSKETIDRCLNVPVLLDAGISVAAINYRLIPQATAEGMSPPVTGPLRDAARAVQFIRSKAGEWNIDPQRLGLCGSSAGACSSLWLAFHDDLADPGSGDPIARLSTRPQHAAVLRAQTTLDPQQAKEWIPNSTYGGHAFGKKNFAEALADRQKLLPWIAEYSPYALVSKDDPGVALFYDTPPDMGKAQKDPTHSANHGIGLQQRCKSLKVPCELIHPGVKDPKYKNATEYLIEKLKSKS